MGVFIAGRGKTRDARIISRNGTDYTADFPEIVEAATELPAKTAALDGEVVVLDERGRSSFQLLPATRREPARPGLLRVRPSRARRRGPDADAARGAKAPLGEARRPACGHQPLHAPFDAPARRCSPTRAGSARRGSSASAGRRPTGRASLSDWQKTKCVRRQEFVVGGFTEPERSRVGVGSILVALTTMAGALRFAGKSAPAADGTTHSAADSASSSTPRGRPTPFDPAPPRLWADRPLGRSRDSWRTCSPPSGPATGKSGTHRYRASARTSDRQMSGASSPNDEYAQGAPMALLPRRDELGLGQAPSLPAARDRRRRSPTAAPDA